MTKIKKRRVKEFIFNQLKVAQEMKVECEKLSNEIFDVRICLLYAESVVHSLETLKKYVDQQCVSSEVLKLTLNIVAISCDEIVKITNDRKDLEPIELPASKISIIIYSCYRHEWVYKKTK